jgi:hypothetical protein
MPLNRALLALCVSIGVSLGLSLGIQAIAEESEPAPQVASVVWNERPATVDELAADAAVLVEARVTAIADGPPLVSPHPDEAPDEGQIPTQRVALETITALDGQIAPTFNVFKTGSADVHLQGDPLYEVGEAYVLFLEPQGEPGTWIPVAPDGRLALDAEGEAEPVIAGPVARDLQGLTPEQIDEAAE